jgi:Ser/Thr protein kinase RdoA (MazF antagonist)
LEWLAFLAEQNGPVASPVRSSQGKLIELVEHAGQVYLAGAFEKAPGVLAEGMAPGEWSDELFQALGGALGRCHRAAQDYVPRRSELKRPEWDRAGNCFNPIEELEQATPAILERRNAVLAQILALPKDRESYGLAHLDLHFGNFFVDLERQSIVLFDFDDCAYGWYVMDLAMLLFDVLVVYDGLDRERFGERFVTNVLKGYHVHKPVNQFWLRQLPLFLKLLEIGVYVMLAPYYNPATADEWVSKYMPGRRERIEGEVPYLDLDFEGVYRRVLAPKTGN